MSSAFCGHFCGYGLSGTPVLQGPQCCHVSLLHSQEQGSWLPCNTGNPGPHWWDNKPQGWVVLALPPSLPSLATPSENTGGLLRPESPAPWKHEGPSAAPAKLPSPRPALMCGPSLLPDVRKSFTLCDQPPALPLVPRQTLISVGPTLSLWTLESSAHVQPAVEPQLCLEWEAGGCFHLPGSQPCRPPPSSIHPYRMAPQNCTLLPSGRRL